MTYLTRVKLFVYLREIIITSMMGYMEKTEVKVLNNVKEDAKRNYELFKWKLVDEKNDLKETTLTFERDDNVPHYHEIVKLEDKFNRVYSIPSWIFYSLIALTLVYVSIMAILWLTKVINVEKTVFVVILAIPTGILLLLNVFLSYLRTKQMSNHINHKEEKYQKYQKLIDNLDK